MGCQRLRKKLLCPDCATIGKDVFKEKSWDGENHTDACTHEPKDAGGAAITAFSQVEKLPPSKRKQIIQILDTFLESEKFEKAGHL